MTSARIALVVFAGWLIAALVVGERYPLSRFAMYAEMPAGPTAVPVFQADGVDADPADFLDYTGFDGTLAAPPAPCALGWKMDALKAAIERRRGGEVGAVEVALGYRVYAPGGSGPVVATPFLPVANGRAWRP